MVSRYGWLVIRYQPLPRQLNTHNGHRRTSSKQAIGHYSFHRIVRLWAFMSAYVALSAEVRRMIMGVYDTYTHNPPERNLGVIDRCK